MQGGKVIAIVGCGWLGLPLAKHFIRSGWEVKGTTTREEKMAILTNVGIDAYLLDLNSIESISRFKEAIESDVLVINVPPTRGNPSTIPYPKQIALLLDCFEGKGIDQVIFVSSTGVYGNNKDRYTDYDKADNATTKGNPILDAEQEVINSGIPFCILRYSGLAGPGRNLAEVMHRYGKVPNPNERVNFIHLEDCIQIIAEVVQKRIIGEIFNGSAPKHPTKRDYYAKACEKAGLPSFDYAGREEEKDTSRIIDSPKLEKLLGYTWIYPDPLGFTY